MSYTGILETVNSVAQRKWDGEMSGGECPYPCCVMWTMKARMCAWIFMVPWQHIISYFY